MKLRVTLLALTLPVFAACGGSAPATRTAADEGPQLAMRPIGGCTQRSVGEGVVAIAPGALPWQYVVSTESTIRCEEARVLISLAPGSSVVLGSFDDPDGAVAAVAGPAFVAGIFDDVRASDPDALLVEERIRVLGESGALGNCATIRWTLEGTTQRLETCAAIRSSAGVAHLVLATVSDTEEGWASADVTVEALLGGLADNLVLP